MADRALGARSRSATRTFSPEGGDDDGGEGLIRQSRGNVAIDRVSGSAGTSARAWSPTIQPLAPEVFLRISGPLRPPSDEQWGPPEVDRALRLAKDRTSIAFRDAQHEQASTLA